VLQQARSTLVLFDEALSPVQGQNLEGGAVASGDGSHRADPRHLRDACPLAEARMQVELAQLEYLLLGSPGCGRICRASAAASGCGGRARRSSRPTGGAIRKKIATLAPPTRGRGRSSRQSTSGATAPSPEPRWSAIRTPASRASSAPCRATTCLSKTGCSRPSTRSRAR